MGYDALCGNAPVKKSLQKMLETEHISNTYVFEGQEGVGKRLCAALFAKALVCENDPKHAPCGSCSACLKVASGNHPDIVHVKQAAEEKSIGVDEVRQQILDEIYLKPFLAKRRVFIIGEGDLLTDGAQNALLKALEEPPEYVVFILCVTSRDKLLETVISRSCVMRFSPLSQEQVRQYLKKKQYDETRIALAVGICQGSIGRALSFLSDQKGEQLFEDSIKHLTALRQNTAVVQTTALFLREERAHIDDIINFMMTFLRDCMFVKSGLPSSVLYQSKLSYMHTFTEGISKKALLSAYDRLVQLQLRFKENLNYSASVFETTMRIWEDFHDKGSGHSI